jgi:hypothetical protein
MQHGGVAREVNYRVLMRRNVAEPCDLEIDQAQHYLRRRNRMTESRSDNVKSKS